MSHNISKFKCLLISTNRERLPVPVIPLGVCLVATELNANGFDVQVLDLAFEKNPIHSITARLNMFQPDIVCLSIRNIDNANFLGPIFYLKEVKAYVQTIKKVSKAPVMIGGSAFNIAPEPILDYVGADFGVWGDGEHVLVQSLQAILRGESYSVLPGFVVKGHNNKGNYAAFRSPELSIYTDRDIFSWINLKHYLRKGANLPVQTKRGCPKKCVYCTYNNIEGYRSRFKDPQEVAEEVACHVRRYRPKVVEFVDSIFNVPQSHAIQVCEALTKKRLPVEFEASSISAGDVSEALFESLKQAGFNSAVLTPDSASDAVLKELKKGFGLDEVIKAAGYAQRVSIPVLWSFIMGGPGETEETVHETFRFIKEQIGKKDVAFMVFGVRIYPGTEMAKRAREEGIVSQDDSLVEPRFYFSKELQRDDLIKLVREEARGIKNLITVIDNQHPLVEKLTPLARLLRLPGPLWRYSRWLRTIRATLS